MPFILDSDTFIFLGKGNTKIRDRIRVEGESNIFLTSISVAEVYFGAFYSEQQENNLKLAKSMLEKAQILNFTKNTAKVFGRLKAESYKRGKPVADMDLAIAAIAIFHQYTLVTHNTRHFASLRELMIEDWS